MAERGWRTRKSGRDEMFAAAEDSELWIESRDPVLVHGLSRDLRLTMSRLAESFRSRRLGFWIEAYDSQRVLIEKTEEKTQKE